VLVAAASAVQNLGIPISFRLSHGDLHIALDEDIASQHAQFSRAHLRGQGSRHVQFRALREREIESRGAALDMAAVKAWRARVGRTPTQWRVLQVAGSMSPCPTGSQ
jgi:hypothetical protein